MSSSKNQPKKILILALSGIGNLLMQLPTIEALKKAHPNWHLTVWVAPRGTKALVEHNPIVDRIIESKIKRSLFGHAVFAWNLRRSQPDITLMLSPGQLIKGAVYMLASGAPLRIAHQYPHLGNATSSFLLTKSLPETENTHDIEQNIQLLTLLGIPIEHVVGQPYHYSPPTESTQLGADLFRSMAIPQDKIIIGFHAGSAGNFPWKRWPLDSFAQVATTLIVRHNAHILIFGGPDEKKLKKGLQNMIGKDHTTIVSADLNTTAAVMKHCQLFLSNDSGLMHLAAAAGALTVGIFGPTDEIKTGPRGSKSHVIRAPHTKPAYITETNWNLGDKAHPTLLALTPQVVIKTIAPLLI